MPYRFFRRRKSKSSAPEASSRLIEPLESRVLLAGTGLKGEYFDNADLTNYKFTRTDATLNFNFGASAPDASMGADQYSMRWTGQIEAPVSGNFTFYINQDDGFRAWGASYLAVDHFVTHASADETPISFPLTAGQRYGVRIEYFKGTGSGQIQLRWSGPGIAKQVIPQTYLYPSAAALPSPWVDNEVGAPGRVANATYANGVFTLKGGGASITGTNDQFEFANQFLSGDGEINGNVSSMQNTNSQAESGAMFRQSMAANSPYVGVLILPSGAARLQYRSTAGGAVTTVNGPSSGQHWFRIVRSGTTFTGYSSATKGVWTQIGQINIASIGSTGFIGLASHAHNNAALNKSTFDNVQVLRNVTPTTAYPFADSMAPNQSAANTEIANSYTAWKSKYVTSTGAGGFLRVQRTENNNDTVSEGIGYGMILAAYNNDKTTFDGLWNYAKSHFNVHGVMNWHITPQNTIASGGNNGATDGDEDMAFALCVADKNWGGYTADCVALINTIYANEVESGTNVLRPGDFFGGASQTNPSYFAPAFYKIFKAKTGNAGWDNVVNSCYQILANVNSKNSGTGLVPAWCKSDGTAVAGQNYTYQYDATRMPLRIAMDWAWFGDSRAKAQLDLINAFFKNIGATNIKDGYSITGTVQGQFHNAAFVSPAAAGAIASTDTAYKTAMFNETVSLTAFGNYYNDSIRLISLIFMAGKMQAP